MPARELSSDMFAGLRCRPGILRSMLMPRCVWGAFRLVRVRGKIQFALCAPEDHSFCLFSSQWAPSSAARSFRDVRPDPGLGEALVRGIPTTVNP
jgi:hypothetical protein